MIRFAVRVVVAVLAFLGVWCVLWHTNPTGPIQTRVCATAPVLCPSGANHAADMLGGHREEQQ